MELGVIGREELPMFEAFLEPGAAAELADGRPVPALGLTEEGTACGAMVLRSRGGLLELRSLYVSPDYRRRGGGRQLMEAAAGLGRTTCAVMTAELDTTEPEWETLPPFLEALGFRRDGEREELGTITLGALCSLPFFAGRSGGRLAVPFARVPRQALLEVYQQCAVRRENYLDRSTFLDGLDPELSMAVLEGDRVVSFVAIREPEPGWAELCWAKAADPRHMVSLLRGACGAAAEKLPPETRFITQAVTPASRKLFRELLPETSPLTQSWVRTLDGRE